MCHIYLLYLYMEITNTLIPTSPELKKAFKIECQKNSTDMTTVTKALWKAYISSSRTKREEREKLLKKVQNGG